jgi:hypothetical protein
LSIHWKYVINGVGYCSTGNSSNLHEVCDESWRKINSGNVVIGLPFKFGSTQVKVMWVVTAYSVGTGYHEDGGSKVLQSRYTTSI